MLQALVGLRPKPTKFELVKMVAKSKAKKYARRVAHPLSYKKREAGEGTAIIKKLFLDSAKKHFMSHRSLLAVMDDGLPPLGEHDEMFSFVSEMNRDVAQGIAD